MIRDITIGQYYPAESVIHRLDPRVKLVGTLTFIISLFLHRSFLMYLVAAVFLTIVIKASKVPFRFMIKGLKAIMVLLLITVVFNMFLTPGTPLIRIWKLTLTVDSRRFRSRTLPAGSSSPKISRISPTAPTVAPTTEPATASR